MCKPKSVGNAGAAVPPWFMRSSLLKMLIISLCWVICATHTEQHLHFGERLLDVSATKFISYTASKIMRHALLLPMGRTMFQSGTETPTRDVGTNMTWTSA